VRDSEEKKRLEGKGLNQNKTIDNRSKINTNYANQATETRQHERFYFSATLRRLALYVFDQDVMRRRHHHFSFIEGCLTQPNIET